MKTHIGDVLPNDGNEWDCQCARCGSSMERERCSECDDGIVYDDYGDGEEEFQCETCDGQGGWHICLSSRAFCEAHPQKGREATQRGEVEWYCPPPSK